ncbi:hypothetical protein TeGR_g4984 [Tetraparma gracilis]|uniref:Uncharacterized protein n=1 Tax=Tetraparma gracilis TaxID=2962635 RepID=A0ABQ6MQR3_9STRA|nr:hypothetical protein TeGR_g4984 [Tetraparma gracilis]
MALSSNRAVAVIAKNGSSTKMARKQSWGGDPDHFDSMKQLQAKYSLGSVPPTTPPTRPCTGEEEEVEVEEEVDDDIDREYRPRPPKTPPTMSSKALDTASTLLSAAKYASILVWHKITPKRKPDILKVHDGDDSPRQEAPRVVYKYMNGPLAAREVKSFRHTVPKQLFNNQKEEEKKSVNQKWMSTDVHERVEHEQEERRRRFTSPVLRDGGEGGELTDHEKQRRQRGFDAALRQYKGGKRDKNKLIKAYTYGSGARHED